MTSSTHFSRTACGSFAASSARDFLRQMFGNGGFGQRVGSHGHISLARPAGAGKGGSIGKSHGNAGESHAHVAGIPYSVKRLGVGWRGAVKPFCPPGATNREDGLVRPPVHMRRFGSCPNGACHVSHAFCASHPFCRRRRLPVERCRRFLDARASMPVVRTRRARSNAEDLRRDRQRCLPAGAAHRSLRRADRHAQGPAQVRRWPRHWSIAARPTGTSTRRSSALTDFDRAIALDPKNAPGVPRARQHLPHHRPARQSAGRRQPGRAARSQRCQAFENRGNVFNNNGQYDRAIADYNEALRLKPDDAQSLHGSRRRLLFQEGLPVGDQRLRRGDQARSEEIATPITDRGRRLQEARPHRPGHRRRQRGDQDRSARRRNISTIAA